MDWAMDKSRPICPQICEQLCNRIALGELKPGERLLSVREVAISAGVNPNTVQKAFEQLSQQGIIYPVRGSGWYVSEDTSLAHQTAQALVRKLITDFLERMAAMGIDRERAKQYVEEWNE